MNIIISNELWYKQRVGYGAEKHFYNSLMLEINLSLDTVLYEGPRFQLDWIL